MHISRSTFEDNAVGKWFGDADHIKMLIWNDGFVYWFVRAGMWVHLRPVGEY